MCVAVLWKKSLGFEERSLRGEDPVSTLGPPARAASAWMSYRAEHCDSSVLTLADTIKKPKPTWTAAACFI